MSLAPVVPLLDLPSLDAQLVHNVYLFMSNKSPQPSALVIFCTGIIMQITCTIEQHCLLGKGWEGGMYMCTTCQVSATRCFQSRLFPPKNKTAPLNFMCPPHKIRGSKLCCGEDFGTSPPFR